MADLFISYARADQPFAERLAALMEQQGWSVWWDRDLVPGNIFDEVIERELGLASAVLVLWSSASVRSQWVRSEASLAAERGNLIPVLTDSTAMPLRFRNLQAVDLSEWDGSATDGRLARLFAGIQSLAGPPAPPAINFPAPEPTPASGTSRRPGPDTPSSEQISAATVPSIAATAPRPPTTTPPTTPASPRPAAQRPPPPPRRSRVLVAVAAGVLVVGAIAAMALISRSSNDSSGSNPTDTAPLETPVTEPETVATTAAPTTEALAETSPPTDPPTTPTTEQPTTATPTRSALDDLNELRAADRTAIESALVEGWVAQLSSKQPGLEANGIVYDYPDILQDHQQLRNAYGALLGWSGDYSSYRQPDFWISYAPDRFASSDEALAWCVSAGRGPDDCFAKFLSHVSGPDGTSVYQS